MTEDAEYDAIVARLRDVIGWVASRDAGVAEELGAALLDLETHVRAATLVQEAGLKQMSVEDGIASLELAPPRTLMLAWVDAARKMLGDAPNYTETPVDFPGVSMEVGLAGEPERYVLTVARRGRVTPHQARLAAEAERDELAAEIDEERRTWYPGRWWSMVYFPEGPDDPHVWCESSDEKEVRASVAKIPEGEGPGVLRRMFHRPDASEWREVS